MKVLVITDSFPKNNFDGIFVYKRVLQLQNNNIDFKIIKPKICLRKNLKLDIQKNYEIINDEDILPVKVINCIRLPGSYKLIGFNTEIRKIVAEYNPDIIHCHFLWNAYNILKCFKNNSLPVVVTSHGSDVHTFPFKSNKFKKQTDFVLKNSDMLIFVSKFLMKKAEKISGKINNAFIIPNGIDNYFIKNYIYSNQKNPVKNLIYIGRLEKIKRAELLPEILSKIILSGVDANMHIIGNGSQKEEIENKAKKFDVSDNVKFYGKVEHEKLPELLKEKDCLLLISENEGWPCVVLEAQACGVPVVGSANGGIPEAIGSGGIVVNDTNLVENVADAVLKILNNPPKSGELIERASEYTWEKIVLREIDLYKSIVK